MSHSVWHVYRVDANLCVMNMHTTDSERWNIVETRESQSEFLYAVVTTGIVCATHCPSRPPRRENVRYFDDLAGALLAGYRPCKRCVGKDTSCVQVANMCRALDENCRVADLSDRFGLTSRHIQRLFGAAIGMSPKAYQIESRIRQFLSHVRQGMNITEASYATGFSSPSRLNEQLRMRSGITATEYKHRILREPIFFTICETPIGIALLAQSVAALCFAGFYDTIESAEAALTEEFGEANTIQVAPDQIEPIFSAFSAAAAGRFDSLVNVPLDIRGTSFQRAVWNQLRDISPGETKTYGEIAQRLGGPTATRAVANAAASNKIALAIPCHRVVPARVGKDYGGYRWGTSRKATLVTNETNS